MTNYVRIHHQGRARKDDVQEFALSECFPSDPLTANRQIKAEATDHLITSQHNLLPKTGREMAQSSPFRFSNATNISSLYPPEHLS